MNPFWSNFWSNFLANLAVVTTISFVGFAARFKIIKGIKKFIDHEVVHALFRIEEVKKEHKSPKSDI